jgi:uncharacterized iron-regulated protein
MDMRQAVPRLLRGLATACLFAGLAACAREGPASGWVHPFGAAHPDVGQIYDVAQARIIDEATLIAELATADFVLLGETHDNHDHHRLQAQLVRALAERGGRRLVVAFEMLDSDLQEQIAEVLSRGPADPEALAAAVGWSDSGWPPFAAYEPLFRAVLDVGATVVAAGLPAARVREVSARGVEALPEALIRRAGLDQPLSDDLRQALEEELFVSHCGRLARDFVPRMVAVQRARDAFMADRLARTSGNGIGVLIAGAGHARLDRGVPLYLQRLAPGKRIRSLAFLEVGSVPRAAWSSQPYDYLWVTPRAHPESWDPCTTITPQASET